MKECRLSDTIATAQSVSTAIAFEFRWNGFELDLKLSEISDNTD